MPYGWVEYRISRDGGKSYSDIQTLSYSMDEFLDGVTMISVEKAVACDDGTIVALCLRNDGTHKYRCEPWDTPTFIVSRDEGKTWSEPQVYSPYRGRTYDAFYHDGVIYVLHLCNEHFTGTLPEHVYRLYKSYDNGKTFEEASVLPIDPIGRGYGSILMDDKGVLHAYAYNVNAEEQMDHATSTDKGKTWILQTPCYLAKGIRNPQTAEIDGIKVGGRAPETVKLMQEKSFEDITVNELCDEAGVRRATFYKHYTDKFDFLSAYIGAQRDDFDKTVWNSDISAPSILR